MALFSSSAQVNLDSEPAAQYQDPETEAATVDFEHLCFSYCDMSVGKKVYVGMNNVFN